MPTTLPIAEPVLIFALAMALFLLAPVLFQRIGIPGIVGLIVAGVLVGPNVTGLLERDFTFDLLGQVGLLYLVFLAGLELDLNRFNQERRRSVVFGVVSFGIPMLLALGLMPLLGFSLPASLLAGAIVGSHTLLAYPVASRLGIVKNTAVVTVVGGTLVTDTLALAVLAVVAGSVAGEATAEFWFTLTASLAVYAAGVLWLIPRLGRWFFRRVPAQAPAEFLFLMTVLFTTAWVADLAGAEPIIGAFLAGLTLNRLIPLTSPLMTRVRFVGNALFIPFFLLSVGMLVDPSVLVEGGGVWLLAGTLSVGVLGGKFLAAWAARAGFGFTKEEGLTMFGLSAPQAAATLAVTFVGLEIGLFDETMINAVIVMILVTVLVGPSLVERFGRRVAFQEERKPYDPATAPRRILIPIANPGTADSLLDVAFILRGAGSEEPLHPLAVVRGREEGTDAQVAEAEKMLSHAVLYSASADVPVTPLTRVDQNVATGIVRAGAETRASTIVVGWDGDSGGGGSAVFGSVLDQLLEQTKQLVVVTRLGHPLNTTKRVVGVVSRASDRQPGYGEAAHLLQRLASELDARLEVLVVDDDPERYRQSFQEIKPSVSAAFRKVAGWGPLLWELRTELGPDDLVVVLGGRRGTVSWHRELDRLPRQLVGLVPESFMVVFPSEVGPEQRRLEVGRELLPPSLQPERIVLGVEADGPREALTAILSHGLEGWPPERIDSVVARLMESEEEFSSEVRPGVAIPHALHRGVPEPTMFLALSPGGVGFPRAEQPVQAVFALVSPPSRRSDHLRILNGIARTVRRAQDLEALLEARELEDVYEWFGERTPEGAAGGKGTSRDGGG